MKRISFFIATCCITISSFAQGNNGLIAHWNFNGNAHDVSGHNLNGVVFGAVQTTGYNNIPNTAYKFRGRPQAAYFYDNIAIPYDSLMNVTKFSICALVRPDSFSSQLCETSSILWRDVEDTSDSYNLFVSDNPHDGTCGVYTPSNELFTGEVAYMHSAVSQNARDYNSYVQLNTWYCVVLTYDGDTQKIYIDGVFKKAVPYHYTLQNGTAPIIIGATGGGPIDSNALYPYPFYGSIDDIRLYSRDLSATDASVYCDSAKMSPTKVAAIETVHPGLTLLPNPTHNSVTVQLNGSKATGNVSLINSLGQVVNEQTLTGNSAQLDLSHLPAGMYIVKVNCGGEILTSKLYKE